QHSPIHPAIFSSCMQSIFWIAHQNIQYTHISRISHTRSKTGREPQRSMRFALVEIPGSDFVTVQDSKCITSRGTRAFESNLPLRPGREPVYMEDTSLDTLISM